MASKAHLLNENVITIKMGGSLILFFSGWGWFGRGLYNFNNSNILRKINPDIKIIEISHTTYNNITACRLLMNDFTIEECIVNNVKSIDSGFTGFLKILQKENIKVTIRQNERS